MSSTHTQSKRSERKKEDTKNRTVYEKKKNPKRSRNEMYRNGFHLAVYCKMCVVNLLTVVKYTAVAISMIEHLSFLDFVREIALKNSSTKSFGNKRSW